MTDFHRTTHQVVPPDPKEQIQLALWANNGSAVVSIPQRVPVTVLSFEQLLLIQVAQETVVHTWPTLYQHAPNRRNTWHVHNLKNKLGHP